MMNFIAHATHHTKTHFKKHHKKYILAWLFSGIWFFAIKIVIVLFWTVWLFQLENTLAALDPAICVGVTEVDETECSALVWIYNSTQGDGWKNNVNWWDNTAICTWGWGSIGCAWNHVVSLNLSDNNLDWSLDLSWLPNITSLDLSKNLALMGISWLWNLSSLITLDLTNIGSSTYPDGLSSLSNLQTISLQSNGYTSFPPIWWLTNLVTINLAWNDISSSSFDLSSLTSLNFLNLSQNDFTTAPSISNSNITILNISNNSFMTDISNLSSLSSLTTLNASYCSIDNDWLWSFTSLPLNGWNIDHNCLTIYEVGWDPLYSYLSANSITYSPQNACGHIYDSSDPSCTWPSYSPSSRTNGNVTAYVTCDKPVNESTSHTFTNNWSYTFSLSNTIYGWSDTIGSSVNWIDRTDPDCDSVPTQTPVNEVISFSVSCRDVNWWDGVSGIDWYAPGTTDRTLLFSRTVTDNSTQTFYAYDNAGNSISISVSVQWFIPSDPECTIIKTPSTRTNGDVDVSLSCIWNPPLVGNDWTQTFTQNSNFSTTVTDTDWDSTVVSDTIDNIDKVAPTCNPTIQYDPADVWGWVMIAEDVTATLIWCTDTWWPGTPNTPSGINALNSQTSLVFSDSGTWDLYVIDNAWNEYRATATVDWIDKIGPTCPIIYDIETPTNGNVVATLWDCWEPVTIINNGWNTDYTFTDNGLFTYTVEDIHGNSSDIVATVNWIDRIPPVCAISYDIHTNTSEPVLATLTGCSEPITITNNGWLADVLFTWNNEFSFDIVDDAGNINITTATVYWIDTSKPVCVISYTPSWPAKTSWDVIALLTSCSKTVTVLNNSWDIYSLFTENSWFTFVYEDALHNTWQTTATVTWIDKQSPTCEVVYSTNQRTSTNVSATLVNCSEPIAVTNNNWVNSYLFKKNWEFTFNFMDIVGNLGSTYAKVNWISKWWGGWISTDYCPHWDFSPSYYDGTCEAEIEHSSADNICEVPDDTPYSDELVSAFLRAYDLWITTMCPIERAALEGNLFRNHMAKMISVFSMKTLWMIPDTSKKCEFSDIINETNEMKAFIKLSCQLWLMGYKADGKTLKINFEPKKVVSRAQFATILSRLLWGNTYDNWNDEFYYTDHITNLKDQKIMSDDYYPPKGPEIRGEMMIMMQKAQIIKDTQ